MSSIFTALAVLLTLLFFTPLLHHLPNRCWRPSSYGGHGLITPSRSPRIVGKPTASP
jgi:hypothetical protein